MPEPTVPDTTGTPATALGPTALVLGVLSAACVCVAALAFGVLPWAVLGGALGITFGLAGVHQARHGIGRLWTALAGTVLSTVGFAGAVGLLYLSFG